MLGRPQRFALFLRRAFAATNLGSDLTSARIPVQDPSRSMLLALNEHGLTLTGLGQAYSQLTCPFASGCRVRLIADVTASGAATLGFILHAVNGSERNVYRELAKDGAPHVEAITTDVANGDVVQPYLFAYTRADRVDARSFGVVVSRVAAKT